MNFFSEMFANKIFWVATLSWFIAQFIKVILSFIIYGKFDARRLVGNGGMPSSHTSFVTALAIGIGKYAGFDSVSFAISAAFALIVMADATGVRRAVGRQAVVVNEILEEVHKKRLLPESKVKELIGHTPYEVIAGFILGIIIAVIF